MSNRRTNKEIKAEKLRQARALRRFLNPNLPARKFCWINNLTIYAAAQRNNKVRIFVQHRDQFKRLNKLEYDQYEEQEVIDYHAAIDAEYERIWKLRKDKINVTEKRKEDPTV